MSGDSLRSERLKKLQLLREAGVEPYPEHSTRDISISDFLAGFEEYEKNGTVKTVAGRVISLRGQGGIIFADIFDGARGQLVILKDEIDVAAFELFKDCVDIGDFVEASVTAYKTKRGERSMKVGTWSMLAKSIMPTPSGWYGIKDEELKLRQRYLDLLFNDDVRAMFVRRAKFWHCIREFLLARGFLEAETPVLETSPGGADARPFGTHHHALDIDVYLRISLELWLKRLLIAGFPKVFEIGRIFRNEGQSREHLQDYTQLETYEAYSDMSKGMEFTQELYRHIVSRVYGKYTFTINGHEVDFTSEWETLDFNDLLRKEYGIDPLECSEGEAIQAAREAKVEFGDSPNKARAIDHLWKRMRKSIAGPAFLVGTPVYLEPLAKRSSKNPNVVERFQIILAGSEMGKGFSELNDPLDQRARFEEQQKLRDGGDDEAHRLDEEYIQAMEYGMPPAFGFGISERLFSFLENRPAHEAQLFPLLKPQQKKLSRKAAEEKYRSKRFIVIADPSVGYGVVANAIGQLGISIGGFSSEKLFDATLLTDADGRSHYVDGLYPMVNLAGDRKPMAAFVMMCYDTGIQIFDFSDIMRKAHSDEEMHKGYAQKKTEEIGYIAVGALVPSDFEKEFIETLPRFE